MNWLRNVAWIVVGLWSAWWTYFALASATEGGASWAEAALPVTGALLLVLGVPALAFRRPGVGALLLTAEGIGLLVWITGSLGNPSPTILFLVLALALPPIAAGLLLLAHQLMGQAPRTT